MFSPSVFQSSSLIYPCIQCQHLCSNLFGVFDFLRYFLLGILFIYLSVFSANFTFLFLPMSLPIIFTQVFFFFLFRIIILYPKIILTRNTLPVNQDSHTIHHSSISSRDLHSYIFQVQPLLFSSLINSYPLLF